MDTIENNYTIKQEESKKQDSFNGTVNNIDDGKEVKRQLTKSIVLISILVLAVAIYAFINYRYEEKFKEEFMLPGPSSEGL